MERILAFCRRIIPRALFESLKPVYHLALAVAGNLIYRFPVRGMIVISVTGTNGKTTTCLLIDEIKIGRAHV